MLKTLYLECNMGAAGDMLMGALYEICPQSVKEEFLILMNDLIPGVAVIAETVSRNGIQGTHMQVLVNGQEEESHEHHHGHEDGHFHEHEEHESGYDHEYEAHENGHFHEHDKMHEIGHFYEHDEMHERGHFLDHEAHENGHFHEHEGHGEGHFHDHEEAHHHEHLHFHEQEEHHDHHHTHEHHSLADIHELILSLELPETVKNRACKVYDRIAAAEGQAHGKEVTEIHFHEVGTKDAVVDVVGTCWLVDKLAPEKLLASPVRTGYGHVHCAHGILSVPAPATAYLLKGIPAYAGDIEGEMCTPTGAALLSEFVEEYVPMPVMVTEMVGYGMGKKEFQILNCVRSFLGTTTEDIKTMDSAGTSNTKAGKPDLTGGQTAALNHPGNVSVQNGTGVNGRIVELSCNLDDMTPEELGYASELLREKGALEVYIASVLMKKNRSGFVLTCLCEPDLEEDLVRIMLAETTTIGVRRKEWERYELSREVTTLETRYGTVRVKTSKGFGTEKKKLEYEDIKRIAGEQGKSFPEVEQEIKREYS